MGLLRRNKRRAIIASAAAARTPDRKADTQQDRASTLEWQKRAFGFYDAIGEVWYSAQFYSRALSRLELTVSQRQPDGTLSRIGVPKVTQDEAGNEVAVAASEDEIAIVELLDRIRDPRGGRTQIMAAYGLLRFLSGEALLCCFQPRPDVEEWECLSTEEMHRKEVKADGTIIWQRKSGTGGGQGEEWIEPGEDTTPAPDEQTVRVYRLWKPHPRWSRLADSPMHGVLDVCEELLLLTLAVRARARSRAAGPGIFYVPTEIDLPADPLADPGDADEGKTSRFMRELTEALTTPISDEGSAASVVPFILRGPASIGDVPASQALFRLPLANPADTYPEQGLREEAVKRLALGFDMPPEQLLGMQDSNHWSAWMVDEQTWRAHLEPVAAALCDEFTLAYFWPELTAAGIVETPQDYVITYDASAVVNHPDRGRDAKDLHAQFVISDRALRDATGFEETDAPSDEERKRRVLEQAASKGRLGGDVAPSGGDPSTGDPGAVEPSAPATEPQTLARIVGGADVAVIRAREAAGARLRQKLRGDAELVLRLAPIPNERIAAELGRERVEALQNGSGPLNAAKLCASAGDCYHSALRQWGVPAEHARRIADVVHEHAVETLFDAEPSSAAAKLTSILGAW